MCERECSLGWRGSEGALHSARNRGCIFNVSIYFSGVKRRVDRLFSNWTLSPTEPSICSAINLLTLSSSVHLLIQPFIHPCTVAKGPCLFVALIIWTNFLCNLFPSQPPTWSSSIRLLKVEPLIPASPFPPITSCVFFLCKP